MEQAPYTEEPRGRGAHSVQVRRRNHVEVCRGTGPAFRPARTASPAAGAGTADGHVGERRRPYGCRVEGGSEGLRHGPRESAIRRAGRAARRCDSGEVGLRRTMAYWRAHPRPRQRQQSKGRIGRRAATSAHAAIRACRCIVITVSRCLLTFAGPPVTVASCDVRPLESRSLALVGSARPGYRDHGT